MESHKQDPTTNETGDPWTAFQDRFDGLRDRIADTYAKAAEGDGPTSEEVKAALGTLAGAWDQVASSVGKALSDPEVKDKLKDAASSFAQAVGATISDLGTELRNAVGQEEE